MFWVEMVSEVLNGNFGFFIASVTIARAVTIALYFPATIHAVDDHVITHKLSLVPAKPCVTKGMGEITDRTNKVLIICQEVMFNFSGTTFGDGH